MITLGKALTALTLGKNYEQDEPLNWGLLTRDEISHHENRKAQKPKPTPEPKPNPDSNKDK